MVKRFQFTVLALIAIAASATSADKSALEQGYGAEQTPGQLFFPLLRALENSRESDAALLGAAHRSGWLTQAQAAPAGETSLRPSYFHSHCRLLTAKRRVWSMAESKQTTAEEFTNACALPEESAETAVSSTKVRTTPELEASFGIPPTPREQVACMMTYAVVVERAVERLGKAEGARVVRDDAGQHMTYAVQDLQSNAARAFWHALSDPRTKQEIDSWMTRFDRDEQVCQVPTPTGLAEGKSELRCGAFQMFQDSFMLLRGGRVFAQDNIQGFRIKFAETLE